LLREKNAQSTSRNTIRLPTTLAMAAWSNRAPDPGSTYASKIAMTRQLQGKVLPRKKMCRRDDRPRQNL
jgi:hypothetical protein